MPIDRQPTRTLRRRAARGTGTLEVLLAAAGVSALVGTGLWAQHAARWNAAQQRTEAVLHTLDTAAQQWTASHGELPTGTAAVLAALRTAPETAELVSGVIRLDPASGRAVALDGHGRAVEHRAGNDAAGVFVSAGPDGRFGDVRAPDPATRRDAADNLRSSDLEVPTP